MAEQLQIHSLITNEGMLELSLASVPVPEPAEDEVLVKVEASPINPSDLGLLFGMADMSSAEQGGTAERPTITAPVPEKLRAAMAARAGTPMPVGNEGGGVVVAAGSGELAQSMMGKTVGILGGAMYSQYRCIKAKQCLVMPEGVTPAESASCFVNPLTALGMVETMKLEGFKALCHTAAASNLGQMLQKICIADGIDLVNIVRREEQAELLRGIGAKYVCNSSADSFRQDLTQAIADTGAYVAFDATGGGVLADQILASDGDRIVPLRFDPAQAGLYLRRSGSLTDDAESQLRHDVGSGWLAVDALPAEDRAGSGRGTASARRQGNQDNLRESLHEGSLAG